ncbi:MAG: T9SS type A sorting domain-containing protein [Saprospiraceae bacterium]|nr:T9SS type A sorting domain-containing protein [Saprospiraceae bacterium]
MYSKTHCLLILVLICYTAAFITAQSNPPWRRPLMTATSTDGITFDAPVIFQDSSGVPSVIKWKGDTLVCVFQWFRLPVGSASWDRVAVKYSYDNGLTWTTPQPIQIAGFPPNYQRPFDPTLAVLSADSMRLYFSSSVGLPPMGLDASINTYSAVTTDGLHYAFEPEPRVDVADNKVIDPAVIRFNQSWHYIAPIGAPQQGAYHFVSPDGIHFSQVANIPSDNAHNWTGNYMLNNNELRFYGSGPMIWYNSTGNGGVWNGFVATNLNGGDPSVVQVAPNHYVIVFVGAQYITATSEAAAQKALFFFPNPVKDDLFLQIPAGFTSALFFDVSGKQVKALDGLAPGTQRVDCRDLPDGVYVVQLFGADGVRSGVVVKR